MEQTQVSYVVKWIGYPDDTEWIEEPYENFDHKELLSEFHKRNPQAGKDKRFQVDLVSFLLGYIVLTGYINSKQKTDGLWDGFDRKLQLY